MTKRVRSQTKTDDEQFERFKAAARDHGCNMSGDRFAEVIGMIAKASPPPRETPKPSSKRKG